MKLDKNVNVDDSTQHRIQRVARLPEDYLTALEQITDELSKDLMNRLVQTMYVDNLCDRFEKAIAEGKSAKEVVGDDIVTFVKEYQKEVDYRENEPSNVSKNTNNLLLIDFAIFVGISSANPSLTTLFSEAANFQGTDTIVLAIGAILIIGGFLFKYKQYQKNGMNLLVLPVQIVVLLLVFYFARFTMVSALIILIAFIIADLGTAAFSKGK